MTMPQMPESSSTDIATTQALFASIRTAVRLGRLDECRALLWGNANNIRHYLYSFEIVGSGNSFVKPYVDDALARFFQTIVLLLEKDTKGKLLEVGANPYLMTILIKKIFEFDITLTNFFGTSVYEREVGTSMQCIRSELFGEQYDFSFRTLNIELSDYPFPDDEFDKILFCEVLEHIVVDPLKVFGKLRKVLKPGGELILTTPNALRLINFAHFLAGKNFFDRYHAQNGVYGRHNREFSLSEVVRLLEAEGFRVTTAKTLDRYNYDICEMFVDSYDEQTKLPWTGSELRTILASIGNASSENRGDNIYVVAERCL
jgi:SAM-dependent methyltransferase